MGEIDFIRNERDQLRAQLDSGNVLWRKLVMRSMFCRGVDSQIREYDGELMRQQQGCDDPAEARVLIVKRQAVKEILERLVCRKEVENCFNQDDIAEWEEKYFAKENLNDQ